MRTIQTGFVAWLLITFSLSSCEKEDIFIPDNNPPNYQYISTLQVENYVNRVFIDLIGREPLETEMQLEVLQLQNDSLNESSRRNLIEKLQNSTDFVEADSSYKRAYYYRFYEIAKVRMIEGVENDYLTEDLGTMQNALNAAIMSGDSAQAAYLRAELNEVLDVLAIPEDYMNDSITINELFFRLINNRVYDQINMNTFNFINATFEDLFFRFPTQQEYDLSFEMIESNVSGNILGMTGANRGDYMNIVTSSSQFYEGLIIWAYRSLLIRDPNASEIQYHIQQLLSDRNFQELQVQIMITDEYANF